MLITFVAFATNAQTFFDEEFNTMPPSGWSIDSHSSNWSSNGSANAGGTSPEAQFAWTPQFNGESYLIAPTTDLTVYTSVSFSFKHAVDHYGGAYTLGVATRSGGGDWTTVWSVVNPSSSIDAEEVSVIISNSDVGQPDFEIAFFFSGNSYNINDWYIDDATLFIPFDHDVSTKKIFGDIYFAQGDQYEAAAIVKNKGLNTESFDVILEIYSDENLLFTDTQSVSSLTSGDELTVNFASYELPEENSVYNVVVRTALTGDMNPDNDEKQKYIYTYTTERDMVILEIGTGTWCGYCPGAAMGADDLIENGHDVAVIENHNGDDYANQYSNARNSYYGITGYPTAVFGGMDYVVGGSATQSMYTTYLPFYEGREEIMTAFSLELFGGGVSRNEYNVTGTISKHAPAMNENVVFQLALTETNIPENWGGLNHVNFVTRLMTPDENGTAIDVINNDYIEINLSFTIDPAWDVANCELVYFLQDNDTKEILQGGKVMVNELLSVGINEELEENGITINNIFPNPTTGKTNIVFNQSIASYVKVIIHDITGREVAVLADGIMETGEHHLIWDASINIPEGVYFCTINTDNNKLVEKVIISK